MLVCLHFYHTTGSLHYDDATVGVPFKCFAPLNVAHVQTPILWYDMANHFLCSCIVLFHLWYGNESARGPVDHGAGW